MGVEFLWVFSLNLASLPLQSFLLSYMQAANLAAADIKCQAVCMAWVLLLSMPSLNGLRWKSATAKIFINSVLNVEKPFQTLRLSVKLPIRALPSLSKPTRLFSPKPKYMTMKLLLLACVNRLSLMQELIYSLPMNVTAIIYNPKTSAMRAVCQASLSISIKNALLMSFTPILSIFRLKMMMIQPQQKLPCNTTTAIMNFSSPLLTISTQMTEVLMLTALNVP